MQEVAKAGAHTVSRRRFLGAGAAGVLTALGGPVGADQPPTTTRSVSVGKRRLGKTGLMVPQVGFGSYNLSNPRLVDAAIDAGVTLIETAASYQNGRAEETIGQVMKRRRGDVILGTGWKPDEKATSDELLSQLDGSLKRLQTDYVDLIRAYDVTRPSQLDNPSLYEAFEKARRAGKARHLGLSSHSSEQQEAILDKAIETGRIAYVMVKYNFMEFPHIFELFERADKAGIGIVVFKTGAGERQKEMDDLRQREKLTLKQASIRWALTNPHVASVLTTARSFEQIREYAAAGTGGALTTQQSRLLREYRHRFDREYCRYCGRCSGACPAGVDVDRTMRYAMYHDYYDAPDEARRLYTCLDSAQRAGACSECAGPCRAACPHGLDVPKQLMAAHHRLSLGLT
ncbi:MAG TPA: aldo/keto reductase [Phycisphaerae bacterium]|nr:aldo/keto reductase [Phycisphaerae bacterium]